MASRGLVLPLIHILQRVLVVSEGNLGLNPIRRTERNVGHFWGGGLRQIRPGVLRRLTLICVVVENPVIVVNFSLFLLFEAWRLLVHLLWR